MDLTIGPNAFFWPAETVRAFYRSAAASPAARVVIGEWVCSKRLPFWQNEIPAAVAALQEAGKEVAISSLALVTLPRERKQTRELFDMGLPVEVADLTALDALPDGHPFWVSPVVNVYNEGTLDWLAAKGATRICLPPELPLSSVATLARAGAERGVAIEVWGHGKVPLAISARCYHARLHDRPKDACLFVCEEDPHGRAVETLEGDGFLTVNGVQTMGHSVTTAARQIDALQKAGVSALRLSPQPGDFAALTRAWHEALKAGDGAGLLARLGAIMPEDTFSDGFLDGKPGMAAVEAGLV